MSEEKIILTKSEHMKIWGGNYDYEYLKSKIFPNMSKEERENLRPYEIIVALNEKIRKGEVI